MDFQDFNPDNKIVFRKGGYTTVAYSFKMLLDIEGITYYSTDESKFRDDDFILYFKDIDYKKARSLYNKFLDNLKYPGEYEDSSLEYDPETDSSNSPDLMTKFMRNGALIMIVALIVLFLGMYLTYAFNK